MLYPYQNVIFILALATILQFLYLSNSYSYINIFQVTFDLIQTFSCNFEWNINKCDSLFESILQNLNFLR